MPKTPPSDGTRSQTPPMGTPGLSKENKIRIGPTEMVEGSGDQRKVTIMDGGKTTGLGGNMKTMPGGKQGNTVDTLYSLFLNHLLRPREWSA